MEENKDIIKDSSLKKFYLTELSGMIMEVIIDPENGAKNKFNNLANRNYNYSLMIFSSVAILYFILTIFSEWNSLNYLNLLELLTPVILILLFLFLLSGFSFVIKAIFSSQKFKSELLTGAMCGIPMIIFGLFLFLFRLFSKDLIYNISNISYNTNINIFIWLIFLFVFLNLLNVFYQSLKISGIKTSIAWYISPISIIASLYITLEIVL